jgi:hypothetical protein
MIQRILLAALLLAFVASAGGQSRHKGAKPSTKKLYCWNDASGHRTCGDTLPPGATDLARTEINAASGAHTGQVARALTDEERAAAAAATAKAQADALANAERARNDLAMVESYATEADLRRAYGERTSLLDDSLKASAMSEANLRRSLVVLLDQANNQQLAGHRVAASLLANLQSQHSELLKQQRITAGQRADRASLDADLADALERYRALKAPEAATTAPAPAP